MITAGAAGYPQTAHYRLEGGDSVSGAGRSAPGGPGGGADAVVLLHGLGGDLVQLWDVAEGKVGAKAVAKLAPDARAHGESELGDAPALSFELLAADLVGLTDRLGLGPRLVLVGVSMGAATALAVALGAPQRVRALALIRPAWRHEPSPENLAVFGEIARLLRRDGPVLGLERFTASARYRDVSRVSPSVCASLMDQFSKPRALTRVRRLEELPASVPYRDPSAPSGLVVPTLVVGAPGDPVHPMAYAEELAGLVPGAAFATLASRDLEPEQNRADLRAAVQGFLAELPTGETAAGGR